MKFNMLMIGVGGEGILLTSVIVARAAGFEGHDVRGTQIHGLAQRGGSIPIHLRFGKGVYSPLIPRGSADTILALEPVEAARFCYFASKDRTSFLIDDYPLVPGLVKASGETYPEIDYIKRIIEPYAKDILVADASNVCVKKFNNALYGNIMTLGIAVSSGMLPLKEQSLIKALETTVPRNLKENIEAFRMGIEVGSKPEAGKAENSASKISK